MNDFKQVLYRITNVAEILAFIGLTALAGLGLSTPDKGLAVGLFLVGAIAIKIIKAMIYYIIGPQEKS